MARRTKATPGELPETVADAYATSGAAIEFGRGMFGMLPKRL